MKHDTNSRESTISLQQPKLFKYKFPLHVKHEAIELAKRVGLKRASVLLNIDKKNIDRWMNKGFFHKKGAGRKTRNPQMEAEIVERALDYVRKNRKMPPRKFIRAVAKLYVSDRFKASKGWCDKFMQRNKAKFCRCLDEVKKACQNK